MNCKPGDLARVVRNGAIAPTDGILDRIVEVKRYAVAGEILVSVCGQKFRVDTDGCPILWIVTSASPLPWADGGNAYLFWERALGDQYLRRLGGVSLADDVESEAKVPNSLTHFTRQG